jgi:hypothetical protein
MAKQTFTVPWLPYAETLIEPKTGEEDQIVKDESQFGGVVYCRGFYCRGGLYCRGGFYCRGSISCQVD